MNKFVIACFFAVFFEHFCQTL